MTSPSKFPPIRALTHLSHFAIDTKRTTTTFREKVQHLHSLRTKRNNMAPPNRPSHPAVPKTTSVVHGAAVNIVLKADQPTGRTVSGVVRDVLTRGNHPRGIKVRLADGRVGRVQSMASGTAFTSEQSGVVDEGLVEGFDNATIENEDGGGNAFRGYAPRGRGGRRRGGGRRFENVGEEELPSQTIGLDAYVKEAKPKRKGKGGTSSSSAAEATESDRTTPATATANSMSETLTCPVCGAFEGDEAAVSHHVTGHFEDNP